jgi:hypothetical protein
VVVDLRRDELCPADALVLAAHIRAAAATLAETPGPK